MSPSLLRYSCDTEPDGLAHFGQDMSLNQDELCRRVHPQPNKRSKGIFPLYHYNHAKH